LITILGPTATGKTALAARLAYELGGEVISADSRQVYKGMTIGAGKDYEDYLVNGVQIPYHLVDIAEPGHEYNIFEYQRDFFEAYGGITGRNRLPILCGGSGMYLETVLKGYQLYQAAESDDYLASLNQMTDQELMLLLQSITTPHNITDYEDRQRMIKAIMVARSTKHHLKDSTGRLSEDNQGQYSFPRIESTIFGISYPREMVMARIAARLEQRLEHGMIEEVNHLLACGLTPDRLIRYGLEYKFVTLYITGKISRNELSLKLNIAIRQFAKRQMTWFRRMERQGCQIIWIDGRLSSDQKVAEILTRLKR